MINDVNFKIVSKENKNIEKKKSNQTRNIRKT